MTKNFRTFLFISMMAAILGLIFGTPFGLFWAVVAGLGLVLTEAIINQPINLLLWIMLCYLITVEICWIVLLKKTPQLSKTS